MNNLKKGIVLDVDRSFGVLEYCGIGEERTQRGQSGRPRLVERVYNLASSEQPGNIEVHVPGARAQKAFEILQKVRLVNPILTTNAKAVNGNGYADFTLTADDIEAVQ